MAGELFPLPFLLSETVIKLLLLIFLGLYLTFSLLVVRQIQLLTNTLGTALSPLLKMVANLHALFALGILLIILVVL